MSEEFNPLVSIIIPVFNGSNYVAEAIDSALAQTYKNIEIIVVNDGSTDDTETIVKQYGDKINYYKKENGGVASALNLAISKAKGEFISWLSHDDVYYPDKVEVQIKRLAEFKKEQRDKTIIFSSFDENNVELNQKIKNFDGIKNYIDKEPLHTYIMLDAFFYSRINGCTLLIPNKCFKEIGLYDETQKTIQDYVFFIKCYKAGIKYIYIDQALIVSRHHKGQDHLKLIDLHIKEITYLYKWAFDLFKDVFQKMPFWQFNKFLETMKIRTLDKTYAYMISEWANGNWNENKPIIWMYWENALGKRTPDYIRLCWKTIINFNRFDFRIKILTEDDIEKYLPKISKNYQFLNKIAHRANYLSFHLLNNYGGLWLNSDFICFRSFKEVTKLIDQYGFVCNANGQRNNRYLPTTDFLASKPNNEVTFKIVKLLDQAIENQVKNNTIADWDELIKKNLEELINDPKCKSYVFPSSYFYIIQSLNYENKENINTNIHALLEEKNIYALGQKLANRTESPEFNSLTEIEILSPNNTISKMFRLGLSFEAMPIIAENNIITSGRKVWRKAKEVTKNLAGKIIGVKPLYRKLKQIYRK